MQGVGLLEGVPAATKTALTKTYKQRQGDRRVRSADLLPVLSLPGSKKVTRKPARMNFMPAEDEENLESLEDSVEAGMLKISLSSVVLALRPWSRFQIRLRHAYAFALGFCKDL